MLNVGVIFHNNEDLVEPFFYFLRRATKIPYRVIAVNNGSQDRTWLKLALQMRECDFMLTSEENVGVAKARNMILHKIHTINSQRYEPLALLDSDVFIVRNESIDMMYEVLQKNQKAGAVFGVIHSFHDWATHDRGISFCMISEKMFSEVGLFDERFFCFYDDSDFMKRITVARYLLTTCETAKCVHAWGSTLWDSKPRVNTNEILQRDTAEFNAKWKTNIKAETR